MVVTLLTRAKSVSGCPLARKATQPGNQAGFNNRRLPPKLCGRMQSTERTNPADSPTATLDYQASPTGAWGKSKAFIKRLGPAGPLAVLVATFPPLGGFVLIGLISRLAPWLRAHPSPGLVI